MKRNFVMMAIVLLAAICSATLAPWPVQKEYYGVLAHWRFNDNQVAGAVAQYKLDDEAANTTVDNNLGTDGTFGHGNTDAHNAAAWCTNFGQSLEFDGANDYIDTNQTFQTTFQDSFSISIWVQPHDGQPVPWRSLCGTYDNWAIVNIAIAPGGYLYAEYAADPNIVEAITTNPVFGDGEQNWHHVLAVFDMNSAITIYVDGVQRSLMSEYEGDLTKQEHGNFSTSYNFAIAGVNAYDNIYDKFDGRIDNVVIYSKVLTPKDATWIATHGDEDTEDGITTVYGSDPSSKNLTSQTPIADIADASGLVGRCFTLDGTNDYMFRADDSTYDFGTSDDFSIALWVKTEMTSSGRLVYKKDSTGLGYYVTVYNSGNDHNVKFNVHNGTTSILATSSMNTINDGEWHHIVAVRDAGSYPKVYVDGTLSGTATSAESYNMANSEELYIGCDYNNANKFFGSLDDIIIFNRALTAPEVDALHDRGLAGLEVSSPYSDWRFWEDVRIALWSMRWNRGGYPQVMTFPALSEFQSGGSRASQEYAIGELILLYDGDIYVNRTAKTSTPLSGGLNPSTDNNWYLAASPVSYHQWDKLQDRWAYDRPSATWKHGHDWLPEQLDPYAQSAGTTNAGEIKLPTPTPVSLTSAIIQGYVDKFEEYWNWTENMFVRCGPTDTFEAWWEEIHGDAYQNADGWTFPAESEFFNSSGSALDLVLQTTGDFAYKWYLDTSHVANFSGQENDSEWLAFHPRWYSGGSWTDWTESSQGYIQGVWKRVPKYKDVSYNHATSNQLRMWMGDASQEPPGLYGKTYRDRYTRCAVVGGVPDTDAHVSGTNSLYLSEVESLYDSQYGYWDGSWHNGSVAYNGTQMYSAVEDTSDATYTEQETIDVCAMFGGLSYSTDENGKNGVYGTNGSFIGLASGQVSVITPNPVNVGSGISISLIDPYFSSASQVLASHQTGLINVPMSDTSTPFPTLVDLYSRWNHRFCEDPAVESTGVSPWPAGWTHSATGGCLDSIQTGNVWQVWGDLWLRWCDNYTWGNTIRASGLGMWYPSGTVFRDKTFAPITWYGGWVGIIYTKDIVEGRVHAPYSLNFKHGTGLISDSRTAEPLSFPLFGRIPDTFVVPVFVPAIDFYPQWKNEDGSCKYIGSTFPYTIFNSGHAYNGFVSCPSNPSSGYAGYKYASATKRDIGAIMDSLIHPTYDRKADSAGGPIYGGEVQ